MLFAAHQVKVIHDLYRGKLSIGFIDEPVVRWDIEVRVGALHLPDWLEDTLPSWLASKTLKRYTPAEPLELDLDLVSLMAEMTKTQRDEDAAASLAASGTSSGAGRTTAARVARRGLS